MKVAEFIYLIVGFNIVMNILQISGIAHTNISITDYSTIFVAGTILGLFGGLVGAALSTFLVPNAKTERSVMYGSLATIMTAFFATAFAPFHSLANSLTGSGQTVAVATLSGIELLFVILIWFWLFQIVFGGGEVYQ